MPGEEVPCMAADMKAQIAQATWKLLFERQVRKLTVKDIVEECHITRQAFYYHFEGIPELLRWMIEGYAEETFRQVLAKENAEEGLRCFFVMATNVLPYVKKGIDSNYGQEVRQLLSQYTQRFFAMAADIKNLYPDCTLAEVKIILRYHTQAVIGLLQEWTPEDTNQMDQIVHTVYQMIMEGIPAQKQN